MVYLAFAIRLGGSFTFVAVTALTLCYSLRARIYSYSLRAESSGFLLVAFTENLKILDLQPQHHRNTIFTTEKRYPHTNSMYKFKPQNNLGGCISLEKKFLLEDDFTVVRIIAKIGPPFFRPHLLCTRKKKSRPPSHQKKGSVVLLVYPTQLRRSFLFFLIPLNTNWVGVSYFCL